MLFPISEVRNFAVGLDHPEGIAVGRDGMLYAGGEAGQVYRISPDGSKITTIAQTGGFCLGLTLDREERIYLCDAGRRQLLRVTQDGGITVLAEAFDGKPFLNPNFGVFDDEGNFYFSDSGEWKQGNGVVYRLDVRGRLSLFSPGPFHFANGLALSADHRFLYVVESNLDRVVRIPVRANGTGGTPEVFVEGMARVPDGLAFDREGNLYVTTYASNCIYRVRLDRTVELVCQDVENLFLCQPTNCAFGGPDFDQLYVANLGRNHISVLDLKIPGQPLWNHGTS